jgi:mRNA interferase MazF
MTRKAPKKGDVVWIDFDPQAGHEQAGHRPGLVITTKAFNGKTGFALVCPITNQSKGYPFEIPIEGSQKTTGVILVDQLKSLDWVARSVKAVDSVSPECLQKVIDLSVLILSSDEP